MIELDPKRSFAVQKAEHEVRRQQSEVRAALADLQHAEAKLAKLQAILDAELAKEKK